MSCSKRAVRATRFLSFQSVAPFEFRALSKEDVQKIWAELSEPIQITGEDCKAKVFDSHAEDRAVANIRTSARSPTSIKDPHRPVNS